MTDLLSRLTRWLKRAGNPRASHKTEARNLLSEMQAEGFEIVSIDELARQDAQKNYASPAQDYTPPLPTTFLETARPPVVELTRAERARQLFEQGDFAGLYDLKKASKVYWDRLGFNAQEIDIILANKPA